MRHCWSEGQLRAYLDRELAPAETERLAAHLPECGRCRGNLETLAARAERVAEWINALPEPEPCAAHPRPALAACLALAFLAIHRQRKPVVM
ncbi:MAG: zf-HC2 domain-containing protein, partial [Acidobacteriia bacterium]|nr:zf-HC2 domain-containing protein [Terriglobia bacterium]